MKSDDVANLTLADLLIHPDPTVRKLAQEIVSVLAEVERAKADE